MLDSVQTLSKRALTQQSDFHATNLTQMGDYRLGKHLGAGSYASVKQAVHRASGLTVAIKVYDKTKLVSDSHKRNISREVALLHKLKHESLI